MILIFYSITLYPSSSSLSFSITQPIFTSSIPTLFCLITFLTSFLSISPHLFTSLSLSLSLFLTSFLSISLSRSFPLLPPSQPPPLSFRSPSYRYDTATSAWMIETEDQNTPTPGTEPGPAPGMDGGNSDIHDGKRR